MQSARISLLCYQGVCATRVCVKWVPLFDVGYFQLEMVTNKFNAIIQKNMIPVRHTK